MKKIRNIITAAFGVLFVLSLMAIDSDTWMPLIVCVVSWLVLAVAAYKNGWMYEPERDEAE